MSIACRAVRFQLPMVDEETQLGGPLAAHLDSCLVCQAESVRYRRLQRSLAKLASDTESAPADLARAVEARLDGSLVPPADPVYGRAARVAAGVGAAVAAAGTVVVVRWLRTRAVA